nr:reverse transcriptase domain-containing protein [Tanacetum cinerariifolium]
SRVDPTLLNDFEMATKGNGDPPVPNLRTMEELCQPTWNGRGGTIAPIAIQATNFGLKNDMIQQVQNSCQFHGLPGDDANKHLDKFLHVTQSIKVNRVTDDALYLYLFPHSLTHHATAWFDRLKRNSINTFEKMAKMFLRKYFPPSMVTKLRNEITNFHQRPNESLFEAWERYKLSIDRCPNHNMLLVTQIDTSEECYDLIENMIVHHNDWDTFVQWSESSCSITSSSDPEIVALKPKMAKINKNLMKVLQINQQVIAVTPNCETCGGPHSYNDCPATVGQTQNVYAAGAYNQVLRSLTQNRQYHIRLTFMTKSSALRLLIKKRKKFQIFQDLNFNISFANALIIMTNKEKLYELARTSLNDHCLAVLLKKLPEKQGDLGKFPIPCKFWGMDECLALANLGVNINLMPLFVWNKLSLPELTPTLMNLELADRSIYRPIGIAEDVFVKVGKFYFPADFVVVDFDADHRVPLILERSFLKTGRALIDIYARELTLRVNNEAVAFNLDQTLRYSANYNDMTANRIDVIDMACEEYSQEVISFSDVIASGNPTPYYDPIVSTSSSTLTPFGDSDFLLEEVDAFLTLEDDPTLPEVDHSYYDTEGDILLLKAFLNDDPSLPAPTQGMYLPQI